MERVLKERLPRGQFLNVSAARSANMRASRGHGNRTTEWRLRGALVSAEIKGWSIKTTELCGRPDFVFLKEKLVVFADGCFWHGCPECGHTPKTRRSFWAAKIERNKARDRSVSRILRSAGFVVLRLRECQIKRQLNRCVARIKRLLSSKQPSRSRKAKSGFQP